MPPTTRSKKPSVIEYLYGRYQNNLIPNGIVTSEMVRLAMDATGSSLGRDNPANFLKDVIRSPNANLIWPTLLKENQVSARQRYGGTIVFEFISYTGDQPFPDRFPIDGQENIYTLQSASMPFAARQFGRAEETWLTQIVVNLRVIETQLSLFSPGRRFVRDITHLQMGMKTQPEIDAVFLASYGITASLQSAENLYMTICCEAKQIRQRLLEDQLREQIAKTMNLTKTIVTPQIAAVKPIAIKVVEQTFADGVTENAIYVIEFAALLREDFDDNWAEQTDEQLYSLPLDPVSRTIYRIIPHIAGLNAR